MKRVKESVAVVVRDAHGAFLVARRPADLHDPLAGAWGLPAVTRQHGESERAAAERIGPLKLGVTLKVGSRLGERTDDRGDHVLRLAGYEATIAEGAPSVPQANNSVTQYVACQFSTDPGVLVPAARRGSLCAQIFLAAAGVGWS